MDPKENVALAVADGDQLSLAIGKKGQNVRLAARLTKYRIDVKTSADLKEAGINIGFEQVKYETKENTNEELRSNS